jgi:hypothetical protein
MEIVVVERLLSEPRTFESLDAVERAASACFQLRGVRPVRSFFSRDGRRLICIYQAPDAEAVRQANRAAGLAFESVWTADEFLPADRVILPSDRSA